MMATSPAMGKMEELERRIAALELVLQEKNPQPVDKVRVHAALTLAHDSRFDDGEIYFVKADGGRIKIGFAGNARNRHAALQTANASTLVMVLCLKGDIGVEGRFHSIFAAEHIRGEWFHASETLSEFIRLAPQKAEAYKHRLAITNEEIARAGRLMESVHSAQPGLGPEAT